MSVSSTILRYTRSRTFNLIGQRLLTFLRNASVYMKTYRVPSSFSLWPAQASFFTRGRCRPDYVLPASFPRAVPDHLFPSHRRLVFRAPLALSARPSGAFESKGGCTNSPGQFKYRPLAAGPSPLRPFSSAVPARISRPWYLLPEHLPDVVILDLHPEPPSDLDPGTRPPPVTIPVVGTPNQSGQMARNTPPRDIFGGRHHVFRV